jgi:hypothetical protein
VGWPKPRRLVAIVAAAAVGCVLALVPGVAAAARDDGAGVWSPTASIGGSWSGGSAVTLTDGTVLAVSHGASSDPTDVYEPGSDTWVTGPSLPASRAGWTTSALPGSRALLLGETSCQARAGQPPSSVVSVCAPTSAAYVIGDQGHSLAQVAPMLEARVQPLAVALRDGQVLVAGGSGSSCRTTFLDGYTCAPLASAEVFDPSSDSWHAVAPMPEASAEPHGALLSDGAVLVIAGARALRFNPGSGRWTLVRRPLRARAGASLFALPGNRALVLGGLAGEGSYGSLGTAADAQPARCQPSTEIFALRSGTWTSGPTVPGGEALCEPATQLGRGQLLFPAVTGPGAAVRWYLLSANQACWTPTSAPLVMRTRPLVSALSDGRALVFGGLGGEGEAPGAEAFTPTATRCAGTPSPQVARR